MGTLSKRELDALVGEAIVDAYDEGPGIAAICRRGKERQRIRILDLPLPLPLPPPAGSEWIAAYRHWLTGA